MMYSILKVSPKACGHTQGRKVVSREEAILHIKAAVDARKESGSDIVIEARTDSRQALSLDEALWRARAFADAGADVLFIDALASREEMKAFCAISPGVPKMVRLDLLYAVVLFRIICNRRERVMSSAYSVILL
jgi:2-methylisocitrate lyase-like PEP mutase family enzyme